MACRPRFIAGWSALRTTPEHVPDLVHPAALDRQVGIDGRERREQAGAAVDADHLEAGAVEAAAEQVAEAGLPLGGALGRGQAEVDDLLAAVGQEAGVSATHGISSNPKH